MESAFQDGTYITHLDQHNMHKTISKFGWSLDKQKSLEGLREPERTYFTRPLWLFILQYGNDYFSQTRWNTAINKMAHSILVTGASGYLGGTLLALLNDTKLPSYKKLFALVRTDEQAEAVKQYHAEPLRADLGNEEAIVAAIVDNEITIVYHLTSAMSSTSQQCFIKGLSKVKEKTKLDVHLLHVSAEP